MERVVKCDIGHCSEIDAVLPLVSIVVPIYNAENYLERSLKSLLKQTLKDIEIILVNDGSTDASLSICEDYKRRDSRIVLINQENQGVSRARNVGIEHAKAKYIAFMDPDDDIDPRIYEILYSNIIDYKVDLVLCNYVVVKGEEQFKIMLPYNTGLHKRDNIVDIMLEMIGPEFFGRPTVMASSWRGLYKMSLIRKNNIIFPIDVHFMEDLMFNVNYLLDTSSLYINNLCLYHYHENPNSAVTKYKNYQWDNEQKIFSSILDRLQHNNLYEMAISRLANRWGRGVLSCIVNEVNPQNGISNRNKLKNIKKFLTDSRTLEYIPCINTDKSSMKDKFIAYLLRKRMTILLYLLKSSQIGLKQFIK